MILYRRPQLFWGKDMGSTTLNMNSTKCPLCCDTPREYQSTTEATNESCPVSVVCRISCTQHTERQSLLPTKIAIYYQCLALDSSRRRAAYPFQDPKGVFESTSNLTYTGTKLTSGPCTPAHRIRDMWSPVAQASHILVLQHFTRT